jgi:hypothetical protein
MAFFKYEEKTNDNQKEKIDFKNKSFYSSNALSDLVNPMLDPSMLNLNKLHPTRYENNDYQKKEHIDSTSHIAKYQSAEKKNVRVDIPTDYIKQGLTHYNFCTDIKTYVKKTDYNTPKQGIQKYTNSGAPAPKQISPQGEEMSTEANFKSSAVSLKQKQNEGEIADILKIISDKIGKVQTAGIHFSESFLSTFCSKRSATKNDLELTPKDWMTINLLMLCVKNFENPTLTEQDSETQLLKLKDEITRIHAGSEGELKDYIKESFDFIPNTRAVLCNLIFLH